MSLSFRLLVTQAVLALIAFLIGSCLYVTMALMTVIEGSMEFMGQFVLAAGFNLFVVVVSYWFASTVRSRIQLEVPNRLTLHFTSATMAIVSLVWVILALSEASERRFIGSSYWLAHIALVAVIANWPIRKPRNYTEPTDQEINCDLKVLERLQYILAAAVIFVAAVPLLILTAAVLFGDSAHQSADPSIGNFFLVYLVLALGGIVVASVPIYVGRSINRRRSLASCQLLAGYECLFVPLGTIIGALTIVSTSSSRLGQAFQEHEI